jgi:glycosyltransferase involved in cell wall biosynthesis
MNTNHHHKVLIIETGGWGGIGHYTHCLAESLTKHQMDVRLLTHSDNYQLQQFVKHYCVEQIFKGDGFFLDWKRLYLSWQDEPVIHFQSLLSTRRDWIAFYILKLLLPNVKLVLTAHNVLPHEVQQGETWAYKRLYSVADGIIVHSEATKRKLCNLMQKSFNTPLVVIPHGHYAEITGDILPEREEAIQELGLNNKYQYMVCFGAIRPYKGVDLLMKAVAMVQHWPDHLKVLVIGHLLTGVSEEELVKLRKKLGLEDKIIFDFRYVPEEQIPHIFAVTDISLLPYRHIDQSGILMAAIAAGKPVLCTPVGAFPEVVDQSFGFLTDEVSAKSIANTLRQAIEKREDWANMGRKGKAVANTKYGWDNIAKKTIAFYERVIQS